MVGISRTVNTLLGVNAEDQNNAQLVLFNLSSVDAGPTDGGATALGSNQATAYQIVAQNTWFTGGALGSGFALPETQAAPGGFSGGMRGLFVWVVNTSANYLTAYPHVNDIGAQINLQGNVVCQPNSINAFQALTPGNWFVDGIGAGFAGSIETVASQGNVTATGTTAANSTQITQAMANVSASATTQGIVLPPAMAGLQIAINGAGGGAASFLVWPNGTNTINAGGAGASFTFTPNPSASPTIFFCFVSGAWFSK